MDMFDLDALFPNHQRLTAANKGRMKNGPDVVRLSYLSQHFSVADIQELEEGFLLLDLELSSYDNSGIPQNSFSGMVSEAALFLNQPGIVEVLISGLLTNALYDGLKTLILSCWRKVHNKPTITMTANTVTERVSRFSLLIKVDDNLTLELKTENLDEPTIKFAIDQISSSLDKFKLSNSAIGRVGMKFYNASKLWLPCKDINEPEIIRTVGLDKYIQEINSRQME